MNQKKILLGVTGGIAAYKAAELVRQFVKAGHQVQVVMTRSATSPAAIRRARKLVMPGS